MSVQIRAIYESSYLNIISTIFKDLDLPRLIDRLVPVSPQCQTRASDVVWLLTLDILSGRQALVHVERWAHDIDLPKLIRPGLSPSWLNDDALARHLDRLYEAGIPFYGDVHNGNLPDKTWNPEVLSRVQKQLKQAKIEEEWIYVADSAAMTKDTLAQTKAANAFLITRGPSSLRIVKTALAEADAQDTPWSAPFLILSAYNKRTFYFCFMASPLRTCRTRLMSSVFYCLYVFPSYFIVLPLST